MFSIQSNTTVVKKAADDGIQLSTATATKSLVLFTNNSST